MGFLKTGSSAGVGRDSALFHLLAATPNCTATRGGGMFGSLRSRGGKAWAIAVAVLLTQSAFVYRLVSLLGTHESQNAPTSILECTAIRDDLRAATELIRDHSLALNKLASADYSFLRKDVLRNTKTHNANTSVSEMQGAGAEVTPETESPPEITELSGIPGDEGWGARRTNYKGPHRIYCAVPFVWSLPNDTDSHIPGKKGSIGPRRYNEIMSTWGGKCDKVEFFIDGGSSAAPVMNLPDNVIQINMTRGHFTKYQPAGAAKSNFVRTGKHIWEKMWRSWIWIRENRAHDYEWFFKVDDDSFLFVENARWFVSAQGWSPMDAHYFGHKLYHRREGHLIAGACVGWSRATLELAATVYSRMPKGGMHDERGKCEDRAGATEELSTAICLRSVGVSPEPARDQNQREMILLFQPQAHMQKMKRPPLGDQKEGWYWKNKPAHLGSLEDCCSAQPLALHQFKYKNNLQMLKDGLYSPSTTSAAMKQLTAWLNPTKDPHLTAFWMSIREKLAEKRAEQRNSKFTYKVNE